MEQENKVKDELKNDQLEQLLEQDEIIIKDIIETKKETTPEYKNAKERIYDKIPISLKALDIIIIILIAALVVIMAYFIIKKYS